MNKNSLQKKNCLTKDRNFTRLLIVFTVVFVLCVLLRERAFLNMGNFASMVKQLPEYGLLAIAIGLALLIGGIDLSVVYLANLSAVIAGKFLLFTVHESSSQAAIIGLLFLSFTLCIMTGAVGGLLNGLLISKIGIPAMLATLGTQSLFWGLAVVLTGGSTMSGFPAQLASLIGYSFLGIPIILLIFLACVLAIAFLVSKTVLGRQMKMYGTNNRATVLSGLSNPKIVIATHMLCGILASISGIIMWGRYSSVKADNGAAYTMQAILIAVMGGISPMGGKGSIGGIVLAIFIIQMISSLLNMFNSIPTAFRQIIWGGLLLFVMIFNYLVEQKRANKS